MNQFRKIQFRGVFRDYQQRVLDNADKYLKDGKINIVAVSILFKKTYSRRPRTFI